MVTGRTENQKTFLRLMAHHDLVMALGPAGTGKTALSVGYGCHLLSINTVEKLVFTKPCKEIGETLGSLPGVLNDKIDPFFKNITEEFYKILGKDVFIAKIRMGEIEYVPLQYMRGRNFENSFICLDEAQNATYKQLRAMLTRMCNGSKFVLNGDADQIDLEDGESGLMPMWDRLTALPEVGYIEMTAADNQRHPLVTKILAVT